MFVIGSTNNSETAYLGWRLFVVGIVLIALFYYHVVYIFCELKSNYLLSFFYIESAIFILLTIFTNITIGPKVYFSFNQIFYIHANFLYTFFFSIWSVVVGISFYELYKYIQHSKGIRNTQAKYLILAMFFGFGGGLNTAPAAWGFSVYPYGQIFVCIYGAVITYAIFRHQLLDVRVAVSRFGIFIFVYSLVLGIPIWIGLKMFGTGKWLVPVGIMAVLATLGPSIYIFLQKRAEDKLLRDSRRIQSVLIKFSIGLSSIRQLQKLLKLIINGLGGSLGLDFTGVYLLDQSHNEYLLRLSDPEFKEEVKIKFDHPLLGRLLDKKGPLALDELKHELDTEKKEKADELISIIDLFQSLNGVLIIPAIKEDIVLAFVVLGKTRVKEIHSREFLDVLTVVGNQIALAIENAIFYEETGKDWTQRAHESRVKTMGAMSTGIAHQIRNRLNTISSQGLGIKDLFGSVDSSKITTQQFDEIKKEYDEAMERIFNNIRKGAEICDGIKKYAKKTEDKPEIVKLEDAITGAMRLLELARTNVNFTLMQENTKEIVLWTNFTMLEDILLNMFDNSNDAIASKKEAIKVGEIENGNDSFRVNVYANPNGKMCEIIVEDNGKGILPEHLEEDKGVNVMWFTTKGYQKGTGMGVPMMREFVKFNGGTFKIESEYKKWTRIIFTLPLATEEQKNSGG